MKPPVPASTVVRAIQTAAIGAESKANKRWAERIIERETAGHSVYPIALQFAKEALGIVSLPRDTEADDERAAIQQESA